MSLEKNFEKEFIKKCEIAEEEFQMVLQKFIVESKEFVVLINYQIKNI